MFSFVGGYYKDKGQIQRDWKMGGIGGARYGISKTNKNYVKNIQQIFRHNHLESRWHIKNSWKENILDNSCGKVLWLISFSEDNILKA